MPITSIRVNSTVLRQLIQAPNGPVVRFANRFGRECANAIKRDCPVDTGALRSSIAYRVRVGMLSVVVSIGSNVMYATFVERGTRYMRARPFMRRGFRATLAKLVL